MSTLNSHFTALSHRKHFTYMCEARWNVYQNTLFNFLQIKCSTPLCPRYVSQIKIFFQSSPFETFIGNNRKPFKILHFEIDFVNVVAEFEATLRLLNTLHVYLPQKAVTPLVSVLFAALPKLLNGTAQNNTSENSLSHVDGRKSDR